MYPVKVKNKYDSAKLSELAHTYSVPYLGTYLQDDYKEFTGSHPGVDIVPESMTSEVYSVLDGTVVKAKFSDSYGNYIVVEHKNVPNPENLLKETTLYSCYLHLTKLAIKAGDKVFRGDLIGYTGDSGITTGEHLHFQIDKETAPFHPYWPFTLDEAMERGYSLFEAVNKAVNKPLAELHTVNPLVYLDKLDEFGLFEKKEKISAVDEDETDIFTSEINDLASSFLTLEPTEVTDKIDEDVKVEEIKLKKIASLDTSIDFSNTEVEFKTFLSTEENMSPSDSFIKDLISNGIISGYDDGSLRLGAPISRAEILKMLLKFKKFEIKESHTQHFGDVKEFNWQKKYVDTAVRHKIISPAPQLFRPDDFVTRAEAVKIVIKALKVPTSNFYSASFLDVPSNSWMNKYIASAESEGLLMTNSDYYNPNEPITREEVIFALEKSLD